jgi:hypothetical protein
MYDNGSDEFQLYIARLAFFMGNYLKSYLSFFDQPDGGECGGGVMCVVVCVWWCV